MKLYVKNNKDQWEEVELNQNIVFRRTGQAGDVWQNFNPFTKELFFKKEKAQWKEQVR